MANVLKSLVVYHLINENDGRFFMTKIVFYCFPEYYTKSPFFALQKRHERNTDSTFRSLLDYISLCHICSQVRCNTHRHTQLHEFFCSGQGGWAVKEVRVVREIREIRDSVFLSLNSLISLYSLNSLIW